MRQGQLAVYALRIGAVVVILGAWLIASGPGHVSPLLVPSLPSVASAFWQTITGGELWMAALYTVYEIAVAAVISSILGVLVGFWVARRSARVKIFEPMLAWGYITPFVLFYPLFILVLGIDFSSKIAFAATGAFFPVAYMSARAFSNVNRIYLTMARAFGATPRQSDWTIKIRASLPMVRSGLRIGMATCLIFVILAEMLGSARGLGFLLAKESQTLAVPEAYALTVVILILAAIFQSALNRTMGGDAQMVRR